MVSEIHDLTSNEWFIFITASSVCLITSSRQASLPFDSDMNLKERLSLMNSHPMFQLELEGMRIEEGTDAGADAEFLMELMEINEALDQAQTSEEADKIGQDAKGKQICPFILLSESVVKWFELIVDHKLAQEESCVYPVNWCTADI